MFETMLQLYSDPELVQRLYNDVCHMFETMLQLYSDPELVQRLYNDVCHMFETMLQLYLIQSWFNVCIMMFAICLIYFFRY